MRTSARVLLACVAVSLLTTASSAESQAPSAKTPRWKQAADLSMAILHQSTDLNAMMKGMAWDDEDRIPADELRQIASEACYVVEAASDVLWLRDFARADSQKKVDGFIAEKFRGLVTMMDVWVERSSALQGGFKKPGFATEASKLRDRIREAQRLMKLYYPRAESSQ